MKRISYVFTRVSRGWVAFLATVVFVLFTVFVLPDQATKAESTSGGEGSPDTSFWYSPADLLRYAETYGEAGRESYVRARWTFDLIFPLAYAFFLISTISWLFASAHPEGSRFRLVNLIPFMAMIFDFLENSATSLVMARYPGSTPIATHLAPILTLLKWILVTGSFLVLLLGIAMMANARLRMRQAPRSESA